VKDGTGATWRLILSEPYRLFFPLAALVGAFGVGHWLLYVLRWQSTYTCQGHGFAQVEGFLAAFACGFLLTMIPRRTGTAPAGTPILLLLVACILMAAAASLAARWLVSQAAFLVTLSTLGGFAISRLRGRGRRPPDAFVLVPLGLMQGALGAAAVIAARLGAPLVLSVVGRGWIEQGMFLSLVLGTGHLLLPVLGGFDPPGDGDESPASRARRRAHAALAIALIASFPLQEAVAHATDAAFGARIGCGLRALLFLADALGCMRAIRWPVVPGLHRRAAWLAFWLTPTGLLLAAAFPAHRVGVLHVTFVGGFALLSLTVATHVIASHGGRPDVIAGHPWPMVVIVVLILLAASTRASADLLVDSYWTHVAGAALLFVIALAGWAAWLLPTALRPPRASAALHDLPILRPPDAN
jgi:uncharacterized protein involved in response to NO